MILTFKNVGQGDSILLEWDQSGKSTIGIIDCKKTGQENQIISFLERAPKDYISFLVLSHPHSDHYSGMLELLEYCEAKKLPIRRFIHPLAFHKRYYELLDHANWSAEESMLLKNIILTADRLYQTGLIQKQPIAFQDSTQPLKSNLFHMRCLAPSKQELDRYIEITQTAIQEGDKVKASRAANYLSTVWAIETKLEKVVLLTSDATFETFVRLNGRDKDALEEKRLIGGQIPHHGSIHNHCIEFWRNLDFDINCPLVISSGRKNRHGHPHVDVVRDFSEQHFRLYATNHVFGFKQYFQSARAQILSRKLDTDLKSREFSGVSKQGDQCFEIQEDGLIGGTLR